MTAITQCPQCGAQFKITQEQREAHQGMVQCGSCDRVFNAVDHLYEPPEQMALPLAQNDVAVLNDPIPAYKPFSVDDPDDLVESTVSISPKASARMANDFSHIPDVHLPTKKKTRKPAKHKKYYALGSVVLFFILLLQSAYFFRIDIAAQLPGLKPAMLQLCAALNCTIPLPQKIDLVSIESSELEADPAHADIITLHALLRSRASYELAYPSIELTLTDTQDNALARRTFKPEEYLPPAVDDAAGFPANRESTIKLHLNTSDLKPAGYRLFLFYPQ